MSAFRTIMSIVDPKAAETTPTPRQAASAGAVKPLARSSEGATPSGQTPQLKRKAPGPAEENRVKISRKDISGKYTQTNGGSRSNAPSEASKSHLPATVSTVPYRGTAAPASRKIPSPISKKPVSQSSTVPIPRKSPISGPKISSSSAAAHPDNAPASTTIAPKKGYLALLQKAKEKDASKPPVLPAKNSTTKILTKKERLALKAEASASSKMKKSVGAVQSKQADAKGDNSKLKKPADVGYQGTARPAKPSAHIGYKGTARPSSAPAFNSTGGTPPIKSKPKLTKGRYDGYADWSDLDDMDDEEEDYESDASSAMEGGVWDVEEEEQLALKVARKEDAEALAEEMRLKREKEERKRKLLEMSRKAATKKRY